MKKLCVALVLLIALSVPVAGAQISSPQPPDRVEDMVSQEKNTFAEGLQYVLSVALKKIAPDFREAVRLCAGLFATVLILSLLKSYEGKSKAIVDLSGVVAIGCMMMDGCNTMIRLGSQTVEELSQYGNALIPVMTTALAAQGGTSSAATICAATVFFDAILTKAITYILVPGIYFYLVVAIVNAAVGDRLMIKISDLIRWVLTWGLKLVLYAFTGYISITSVITGTADQTALKAAKVAFGGMIPVVGGIVSDASETILVGAALVKNSVGIYGMLVLIAIVIGPFLKIGVQYLLLKLTAAICGIFSDKSVNGLLESFSTAMGLLLSMTGTVCLLLMISMVCFLKGMG